MRIAVAQIDTPVGNPEANLVKVSAYARKAKALHCELAVFPEMVDTGYDMAAIREHASTWKDTPFQAVSRAAADHGIYMICNLSEREGARIYNTTAVIGPDGTLLGKYRKVHLADYAPLREGETITPGDRLECVEIGGIRFGLMICYDLRFPEMSRALTLAGAEALVLCSAWPFPRLRHLQTLVRARAIENQVFFVSCNRVGGDAGIAFCGASCIVDPYGVTVSSAAEDGEALIVGEVDGSVVEAVRARMSVLQHRRPVDRLGGEGG